MTESCELIDAISAEASAAGHEDITRGLIAWVTDAILAHPGAVLSELENAPCQTCGGWGKVSASSGTRYHGKPPHRWDGATSCPACGGSGKLGRDGLLRLLGVEGGLEWLQHELRGGLSADEIAKRYRVDSEPLGRMMEQSDADGLYDEEQR